MDAVSDVLVPKEVLLNARMSTQDFLIEVATHFYAKRHLSMGQAKRLCGLHQRAFQHELAERGININLDWSDVEKDLENLRHLHNDRSQ